MGQFISYAQNFEDVMLWRALKHIQQGFYVDVGANDPRIDSVTMAFYERGWRGINIEPMQEYYEALCRERPADINLPVAAAATSGNISFFEVPETGLSSAQFEVSSKAQQAGRGTLIERIVSALRLNDILEDHAHEEIHFLKVDVEGFEAEVLKGLDLSRWRPWILVIEATIPGTNSINCDAWEPSLLSSAYHFVYFDGLNRFYAADEHGDLDAAFSAPPNYFDQFVTLPQAWRDSIIQNLEGKQKDFEANQKELEWARGDLTYLREEITRLRDETSQLRDETSQLRDERDRSTTQHKAIEIELVSLRRKNAEVMAQNSALQTQMGGLQGALSASQAETENLRHQYVNILYSQSYRITAPLRAVLSFVITLRRNGLWKKSEKSSAPLPVIAESPIATNEDVQYFQKLFRREIQRRKNE